MIGCRRVPRSARSQDGSAARIAAALEGRPIGDGLKAFLDSLIDSIVAGPGRRGCFIGNCAAEMARLDRPGVAQRCQAITARFGDQNFAVAVEGRLLFEGYTQLDILTVCLPALR